MSKVLIVYNSSRISKDKSGNLKLDTNIMSAVIAVENALKVVGHRVERVALKSNFQKFISMIHGFRPDIIFNLCEMINGNPRLEPNAIAVYEIVGKPYTGNMFRTLGICLNKAFTKQIFQINKIPTPKFAVFDDPEFEDTSLKFPLIVKPGLEDGSVGISIKSVVKNQKTLRTRVKYIISKFKQFALVEQFISGKELQIAVLGNENPRVLGIAELDYKGLPSKYPKICSYAAKWQPNTDYYKFTKPILPARINEKTAKKLEDMALYIYKLFKCRGYARIDLRLRKNKPYFLEVNPNPDISPDAGYARAALHSGLSYEELIEEIVNLGLQQPKFLKFH